MSSLSDNTTRRALDMSPSQQYRPERTHTDGYDAHIPRGDYTAFRARLARALDIEHLRNQINQIGVGE